MKENNVELILHNYQPYSTLFSTNCIYIILIVSDLGEDVWKAIC